MKSADIKPGRFYRDASGDLVRIGRKTEPRYEGDLALWQGTKFQVRGLVTTHHMAKDIKEEVTPDAKTMRIIAVIEEMAGEGDSRV